MRFESFYASFSPSLHPVTHRSFAYSQCHSYVLLWPALLFQLPGLFPSFFSPIGFLWCSHTSYAITLYFLLPLSVRDVLFSFSSGYTAVLACRVFMLFRLLFGTRCRRQVEIDVAREDVIQRKKKKDDQACQRT